MASYEAFFLVGPTAVGKTEVAQFLAERHGYDIVSADSMLVYRGMDIGTAKPGPGQRARVRYWGIDAVGPQDRFSVGAFRALAETAFRAISAAGRTAIVVGGTGLYIKSLTDGLASLPGSNPLVRAYWERVLADQGPETLAAALREKNPTLYAALKDPRNPRRLVRALELAEAGVSAPGATWRRDAGSPPMAGLTSPLSELTRRIERRVVRMYQGGLLDEVRRLREGGLEAGATAWQAIGYAEAMACLKGECSEDEAIAKTAIRTRRLARKQLTWFRHQANVAWTEIDSTVGAEETARRVEDMWRRYGPTPIAGMA